jgi:hypothetical protein
MVRSVWREVLCAPMTTMALGLRKVITIGVKFEDRQSAVDMLCGLPAKEIRS